MSDRAGLRRLCAAERGRGRSGGGSCRDPVLRCPRVPEARQPRGWS